MKNKFILGLILTSVLLMSVVGISAQITGNILGAPCKGKGDCGSAEACSSGGHCYKIAKAGERLPSAEKSSDSVPSTSRVPRGMMAVESADGKMCYVMKDSAKKVLGSLFYRTYSGNVVITGEMTKETCDKMSSGKGTLGPSGMKCTYPTEIMMQSGRLCTMYEGKQVCGRAGEQVHANDGTSFVFKKERKGLGTPAITINVEATESVRQLPKYS